ncbi:MAG: ABC transporter ATP-binding protein/permease [Candidatus Nomurabacteria bacterium]|jgi:ATP-binding cassette subfamily B protein|nr:ABC transporter ATP-binding protein/permease [Candidatus Nomurabacteria bacterium]
MHRFFRYLGRYWWQVILLLAGLALQVWCSLELPSMMSQIVDQGIVGGDQDLIVGKGVEMLGVTFVGGVGTVVAGFLASRIGAGLALRVRQDLFAKIMSFSMTEMSKFSTSSLVTRSTNDINQVQMVTTMALRMSLQAPIMGVGAIMMAFGTAPDMTWIIALAVGVLLALIAVVFVFALPKFSKLQKLVDKLNQVTRENLTGLRVVRAFNNEAREEQKFDAANEDLTRVNLFVNRLMVLVFPVVGLTLNVATLLVIWVGAGYIDGGVVEIGDLMAFMQYAMQVMMAFMFLAMTFIMVPRGAVSWKRINEVLNTTNSIQFPGSAKKPARNLRGVVEFRDVSFAYPGAEDAVLKNISFSTRPGKTTAFIGSTGSGKSTLVNLVPRFFDTTSGEVLVDGVNVRQMSQRDLMSRIGYVPQKGVLFSGTVQSNVAFGSSKNDGKNIKRALDVAQAKSFVSKLSGKLKAPIAQGGNNVSGGQKQRLSIARAIARRPEIYIFDDSFSALDYRTDKNLRAALSKNTSDATVMIVAQRIGTIKKADQIVVLDRGKIAGIGRHYELLKNCAVYREIAASQLSDDEMTAEMKLADKEQHG